MASQGDGRATALLQWSLANAAPRSDGEAPPPPPRVEKKWIDALLQTDGEKMLARLKAFLAADASLADRLEALDDIAAYCETIDAANGLLRGGGLSAMLKALTDPSAEVRWRAAVVLCQCTQNNARFRQVLYENDGIPALRKLLDEQSQPQVVNKAVGALSAALRHSPTACVQFFSLLDGTAAMLRLLADHQSDLQLRQKLLFILSQLVADSPQLASQLLQPPSLSLIFAQLQQQSTQPPDVQLVEHALMLLQALTNQSADNVAALNQAGAVDKLKTLSQLLRSQPDKEAYDEAQKQLLSVVVKLSTKQHVGV